MSNRSQYKAMMEEVHAPANVLARVKGIPMEKKQVGGFALRTATVACAALLGAFAVTNGVCYAATGETWVEKATVYINGEEKQVDVQMHQEGDTTVAEMEYEIADGSGSIVLSTSAEGDGEDMTSGDYSFEINDYTTGTYQVHGDGGDAAVLEAEDGAVLLTVEGVEPIDISSQLKEAGAATGTYDKDGKSYAYKVTGEKGNYHVSVDEK